MLKELKSMRKDDILKSVIYKNIIFQERKQNMKKKAIMCVSVALCLCSGMTAYAAPEIMSDGGIFDAGYYLQHYSGWAYDDIDSSMSAEELYAHCKLHHEYMGNQNRLNIGILDTGKFDATYYAQNNPDVTAALGTDADVLYQHYIKYGKAEGRLGCANENSEHGSVVSELSLGDATVLIYEDGFRIRKSYYKDGITDDIYLIPRTDYSDGLRDEDHNGIDDRDPFNTCGYTDLDYNCVADGAPYYNDVGEVMGAMLCEHNVIDGLFNMNCPKCEPYREKLRNVHAF